MSNARRIWLVGRLAEIGNKLSELDDSRLSREEKQKLGAALRAEREKLTRELHPEADESASCFSPQS